MVRAGRRGAQESVATDQNVITINWNELPDLSSLKTRDELEELYRETYPESEKMKKANHVGQIWRFFHNIQIGDLVALPLSTQSAIIFGSVKSEYKFERLAEDVKHIREVAWIKTIPRTAIDQDLLYSFGAIMTVCEIKRNDAEKRIKAILWKGKPVPPIESNGQESVNIAEYAKDQITEYITRKFKGHGLSHLINAILTVQGYTTAESPPGPDGGVDILASAGPLGFDRPRICVQVKSTSSSTDVKVLRELGGVITKVKADQGLLVSWSGFTSSAIKEARDAFFTTRLWDAGDVLEAIFKHYNKFDDELKAELPLKRIWTLVPEEE